MKTKKQPSLKEQQDKWYKKLEKKCLSCGGTLTKDKECKVCETAGTDIESDEDNLKVWSSVFFARHSLEQIQAKQAYYQMATNLLEDYEFENKRDRIIWEYHANGISYRDISKVLKKVRITLSHTAVQNIVHKLQVAMYLMYKMPQTGPQ